MANFESKLEIGAKVDFTPTFRQAKKMGIKQETMYGEITAVRFTKAKVWYDVLDDYHGVIFNNVPSEKVTEEEVNTKLDNETENLN